MSVLLIVLLVLGGVLGLLLLWAIGTYNRLVSLKAMIKEAWSGIDVQLKRRYDLIPNLVATVKQYSIHEKGIFEEIAKSRANALSARGVEAKADAEKGLTQALRTLFAVAENYPNLKANENFMALQKELSTIENEIQLSRRYYNGVTRDYNIVVQKFPSKVVANVAGFAPEPYFELGSAAERENVKVQF